ncbi:MAG TPA: pyridoxamine 5'-phosphate oxidase family protein, partial [Candidatus Eisenbacteria bacterium]|nr:pyridoxamine 5'-phosphate oxidase family protein [Candidatus Eisenbacteria bacterium]
MQKEIEQLDRAECLKLLQRHPTRIGRVALAGPRPNIFPVNYAVDGDRIVFRTDPGTKFYAAVADSYVAFEVDWVEPTWQIGWSVVARGQAHVLNEPEDLTRVRELPLQPWGPGDKENYISVETELLSGRRIL